MTTKFGLEIEFKGLGSSTALVAATLKAKAHEMGFDFNVRGENYNHETRNYWKVVTDRSVSGGCELVSPPLPTNEESFELLKKVYSVIKACGGRVDRQCGTHIHLDASFLNQINRNTNGKDLFFSTFVQCYRAAEPKFNTLVKHHRNDNQYCRTTLGHDNIPWIINERYHKVNVRQAYDRHQTLEFRHLHGTLNADAVIAWINLCKAFTDNVWKFFKAKNPVFFQLSQPVEMTRRGYVGRLEESRETSCQCQACVDYARREAERMATEDFAMMNRVRSSE